MVSTVPVPGHDDDGVTSGGGMVTSMVGWCNGKWLGCWYPGLVGGSTLALSYLTSLLCIYVFYLVRAYVY